MNLEEARVRMKIRQMLMENEAEQLSLFDEPNLQNMAKYIEEMPAPLWKKINKTLGISDEEYELMLDTMYGRAGAKGLSAYERWHDLENNAPKGVRKLLDLVWSIRE